jgi:hypothetical protein
VATRVRIPLGLQAALYLLRSHVHLGAVRAVRTLSVIRPSQRQNIARRERSEGVRYHSVAVLCGVLVTQRGGGRPTNWGQGVTVGLPGFNSRTS